MMNYLGRAIYSLRTGAEFVIKNDDYSTIVWHVLEGEAPTIEEVEAEMERLRLADLEEQETQKARRSAILERFGLTEDEA